MKSAPAGPLLARLQHLALLGVRRPLALAPLLGVRWPLAGRGHLLAAAGLSLSLSPWSLLSPWSSNTLSAGRFSTSQRSSILLAMTID